MNIADHADGDPGSPALIVARRRDDLLRRAVSQRSQRVAALLYEAGLRRGDGVALVLPNRREFFEITWGCQLSGLYYSAVNTHFTADEVAYVIADSDARAVFIDASMAELVRSRIDGGQRGRRRPHRASAVRCPVGVPTTTRSPKRVRRRRIRTVRRCSTRRAPPGAPRPCGDRCPTDGQGVVGAEGTRVRAHAALRHDRRRACTCRRRRCTTPRGSTTRWRCIGSAPRRS